MLIKKHNYLVKLIIIIVALSLLALGLTLFSHQAMADTQNQAVAQGYSATSNLQPGTIVSLNPTNANQVEPLNYNSISQMFGVVVLPSQSAITLGQSNDSNQVYVTNFGKHDVLVSNQNGPIKVGGYISISSISGVGMAANTSQKLVLGQAAASFNGTANVVGSEVIKNSLNQSQTVEIGTIPVVISIEDNPLKSGPVGLPTILEKISKFATNKSVSADRVYLGALVVLLGTILAITIVYAGVKNGLISIGRNPLAKKIIGAKLFKLVITGIFVLIVSFGAAYLILVI